MLATRRGDAPDVAALSRRVMAAAAAGGLGESDASTVCAQPGWEARWAGGGDAAAAAAARTAKLHERLARVEAAADAASVGFDALQREHVLLQKRYRKLQRRLTGQT